MTDTRDNGYKLLRSKSIYAVLDGDTTFPSKAGEEALSMPYLSGPKLVGILNLFGKPTEYGSLSRWVYVEELVEHCIENDRMPDLLNYFFSIEHFKTTLGGLTADDAIARHKETVQGAIELINGELLFGGHELRVSGGSYVVSKIGSAPSIDVPAIRSIDRPYVKQIAERALADIDNGDFDSALTKARTLLEECFIYAIDKKGTEAVDSGNIGKLYKQVKDLYSMHADSATDRRINTLLSGLEKIVSSIAEMRNKQSDAHGVGTSRITIADYHARLAVNAATNMADFIISVAAHAKGSMPSSDPQTSSMAQRK